MTAHHLQMKYFTQAFSWDLKRGHPKCAKGLAQ